MPTRDAPQRTNATKPRNRLLLALSDNELVRLEAQLERVTLELKQVLFDVDQPIAYVYFPENGVVSVVSVMADGTAVETATVGHEGMVGLPLFHGSDRTSAQAFSQIPGVALRMTADAFREEIGRNGALSQMLHRYSQALLTLIAQSSACNRLHTMRERCARWLLHTHDRVGSDEFPLTHQFLSQMLGVRRATVTEALGAVQETGAITSTMGRIRVTDRAALEAAACECYTIIRREFDRLLGVPDAERLTEPDPLAGLRTRTDEGTSALGDGTPREEPRERAPGASALRRGRT
jgi:CRP-like cAMP-binding protein